MESNQNQDYEFEAKEYIWQLPETTQRKLITAIETLLDDGKDWRFINTALHKKSMNNWVQYGAGLLFNRRFQGSVQEQMDREDRAEEIDLDEFFDLKEEIQEHLAEIKQYGGGRNA